MNKFIACRKRLRRTNRSNLSLTAKLRKRNRLIFIGKFWSFWFFASEK